MQLVLTKVGRYIGILIAFVFLLATPFIATISPVEAMPMEQVGHRAIMRAPVDCTSNCALTSVTMPSAVRLDDKEAASPDPDPEAPPPFYVQFMAWPDHDETLSGPSFLQATIKPPDIRLLTVNFRL